jgi:hypothetical protein
MDQLSISLRYDENIFFDSLHRHENFARTIKRRIPVFSSTANARLSSLQQLCSRTACSSSTLRSQAKLSMKSVKETCQTTTAAHPYPAGRSRNQKRVEIISASAEAVATPKINGEYHSRATRSGLINQVVETVALVRSSVEDVYYRNDSMTVQG